MKTILLLHGANLNKLGQRDVSQYGSLTLSELEEAVKNKAAENDLDVICLQSNHEGVLIDTIQAQAKHCVGMIINPGAFTHYSYALHDAIVDACIPTIEVHLSNIKEREPWRAHSVIAPACITSIMGKKLDGYLEAVDVLTQRLSS